MRCSGNRRLTLWHMRCYYPACFASIREGYRNVNVHKKTHTCGELTKKDVGAMVTLMGWVNTRRDHGGLIFIDLRDRGGITQVVFNPGTSADAHNLAHDIRSEYVLAVTGKVAPRPGTTVNPKLPTGEIEVLVSGLVDPEPVKALAVHDRG